MDFLRILLLFSTIKSCTSHNMEVCGTAFTDPLSSSLQADVVVEAELIDSTQLHKQTPTYYAQFEIYNVLKSDSDFDKTKPIVIGTFTELESNVDKCQFGNLQSHVKYIFFLKASQDETYEMTAFPIQWSRKTAKEIKDFLCSPDTLKEPVVNATESVKNSDFRSNLTIECTSTGVPPPLIRWWYRGNVLQSKKKYHISTLKHSSRLTLIRASHNWHGLYTCEAYNIIGSSNASIQVNVQLHNMTIQSDHSVPCPAHMDNNYCFHNASCHIIVYTGMRSCKCRPGYTGIRCENYWDYDEFKTKTHKGILWNMDMYLLLLILLPVIVGMLVIAVIIATVALIKKKYQQQRYTKANQHQLEI